MIAAAPSPGLARSICLCIDDFGMHAGINQAALQLVAQGRVHAIGCMVGGPAWHDGATALRALHADQLDVGLHLDLTECPLPPHLPHGLAALIALSLLRRLDLPAVRQQIRAQLDAFEQGLGRAPAFVDGHQHVHQFPGIREALLDELQRRGASPRPWLRSTRPPHRALTSSVGNWRESVKPWVIQALGARGLARRATQRGHPQNRHLLGVYDFRGGAARYRQRLREWLRCAVEGDLLMCHPGLGPLGAEALDGARQAEFEVLADADFGALLAAAHVRLCAMSQILAVAPATT